MREGRLSKGKLYRDNEGGGGHSERPEKHGCGKGRGMRKKSQNALGPRFLQRNLFWSGKVSEEGVGGSVGAKFVKADVFTRPKWKEERSLSKTHHARQEAATLFNAPNGQQDTRGRNGDPGLR